MSEQRVTLPGQRLRAEREARGMTEEQVARELNLTISYLKALEADDYERLPEATFIRGYIRNYARLLDVPADDLAHTFDEVMEEEASDQREAFEQNVARPRRRRSGMLGVMAALVVLVAALAYWLLGASGEQAGQDAESEAAVPTETDSAADPAGDSLPAPEQEGTENLSGEPAPALAGQNQQEDIAPNDVTEAVQADATDELVISFRESCWVQVSNEAGETLFAGQKQADERLSLDAAGPFQLKFGNAAAVSLITVNGNVVSMPSSAPGDVVRLTVP